MNKLEAVALMAATIYAGRSQGQSTAESDALYARCAHQAWALYEAVEIEAVRQHSKQ